MVLALVLLISGKVSAAPFQNGSFEIFTCTLSSSTQQLDNGETCLTGWIVDDNNVDLTDYTYWQPSDGKFSLDLNGRDTGSVEQTFDTIPNVQYIVYFDMAGNYTGGSTVKHMCVSATGTSPQCYTFDTTGKSANNMGWTTMQYTFQAVGSSTTLDFYSTDSGYQGPALDNVRVVETTAIPTMNEWGMIIFIMLAGLGAIYYLRRLRKA